MKQHRDLCWAKDDARRPCDCPTAVKWHVNRGELTGRWIATNGIQSRSYSTWWQAYTRARLSAERDIANQPCYCDLPHYVCVPCAMWARVVSHAG